MKDWRLAGALVTLRAQVNAEWPNRDKASDGSIGDARHQAEKSDHNPNARGVVCALDIDADLTATEKVDVLVKALFSSRDSRIKYLIYNRQITYCNYKGIIVGWKYYGGIDPHTSHLHISVKPDARNYDDTRTWDL